MDRSPEGLTTPGDSGDGDDPSGGRRPRDLALLLLAIGTGPPRARARDQQADVAGGELLRRVLDRVAAADPEPEALDETLAAIVEEFGPPEGPTRGVCLQVRQDWEETRAAPGAWAWLIAEAIDRGERGEAPRRRGSRAAP